MVCISIIDCRTSLYTDPRKFRGTDNWKSNPLTITRSPTVMVPESMKPGDDHKKTCEAVMPGSKISATCSDALASEVHNGSETSAEDGILPPVQECQTSGRLQGGFLILSQEMVIFLCFILLIIEILHKIHGNNQSFALQCQLLYS